jgi:hypothetical protein
LVSEEDRRRDELQRELIVDIGILALEHDSAYRAMRDEMMVRTLNQRYEEPRRTFTQQDSNRMSDLIVNAAVEVWRLEAAIGPAVHARARTLALAFQGVRPSDSQIISLSGPEADEFLRPIFEAGGVAERYMSDREDKHVLQRGGTLEIADITENSLAYFADRTSTRLGDMTADDCARLEADARNAGRPLDAEATRVIEEHLGRLTRLGTFAPEEPR